MKIAVTGAVGTNNESPFVFKGNLNEIAKNTAEVGYKNLELHLSDCTNVEYRNLKRLVEIYDLQITSIGTGTLYSQDRICLTHRMPEIRNKAVEKIKEYIHFAAPWRAVVIIGLVKGLVTNAEDLYTYEQYLIENLKKCLETAEQERVTLVLEMINRYESDYLNRIDEGIEFIERMNSDYLKLHIDTYHMNIEETSIEEAIKRAGSLIGHVHLADNDRWYPGHGHFDFNETIQALKEINYNGAVALECFSNPSSKIAALEGLKYVTHLMS